MVELNVQEQCINLFANPIVQRKQVGTAQRGVVSWVIEGGWDNGFPFLMRF